MRVGANTAGEEGGAGGAGCRFSNVSVFLPVPRNAGSAARSTLYVSRIDRFLPRTSPYPPISSSLSMPTANPKAIIHAFVCRRGSFRLRTREFAVGGGILALVAGGLCFLGAGAAKKKKREGGESAAAASAAGAAVELKPPPGTPSPEAGAARTVSFRDSSSLAFLDQASSCVVLTEEFLTADRPISSPNRGATHLMGSGVSGLDLSSLVEAEREGYGMRKMRGSRRAQYLGTSRYKYRPWERRARSRDVATNHTPG